MNNCNQGCNFQQTLVTHTPVYDKRKVMDRKLKIDRPTKRTTKQPHKPKWL
jgi:hypothetical protein